MSLHTASRRKGPTKAHPSTIRLTCKGGMTQGMRMHQLQPEQIVQHACSTSHLSCSIGWKRSAWYLSNARCRFAKFLGILTLESFTSAALGLSVGAFAPSTDAAVAIGPAVMLVWIIFGGYYCNSENIPR